MPGAPSALSPQAAVSAVSLRAVGASTGFKVNLPSTWAGLLDTSSKLVLGGNVTRRIYDKHGDQILALDVVKAGDILYVGADESWRWPHQIEGMMSKYERRQEKKQEKAAAASNAGGRSTPLAELLLSPALRATPVGRAHETPSRLCSARPPWGLLGDPSQLGSGNMANFSKLRGDERKAAHMSLCIATARRMQAANRLSAGRLPPLFPAGATCAIVGSSGSLTGAGHGPAIDRHQVVVRFNLAPAGGEWARDVGNRTTVRILTDKIVAPFFKAYHKPAVAKNKGSSAAQAAKQPKPSNGLSRYGGDDGAEPPPAMLLYCMAQGWVGKCMHEGRSHHVNPVFIKQLRAALDLEQGRGRLPSAGIAGMAMALQRCSVVSLYGFGNASDAKQNGTLNHAAQCGHYWECRRQQGQYFAGKQGYHDWNAQWRLLSSWIEKAAANATTRGLLRFIDGVGTSAFSAPLAS